LIKNCASRYRAFDRSARKIRTIEIGIAEVNNNRVALRGFARQDIKVPSTDILSVFRDPSTVKADRDAIEANDREMLPYYVGCGFKRLDAGETVSEDELVGLEWTYFNALQHSDRPARTLHKALSTKPKFFVELLSAVFASNDNAPPDDPVAFETARAVATQAFRVLDEWKRVPGSDDTGVIDGAALEAWVKEARRLSAEVGLAEVGDSRIGRILSAAPRIPGEAWPPEPVREIIEMCRSRYLEEGFQIGLYNRRGVTVRLPTDGGQLERTRHSISCRCAGLRLHLAADASGVGTDRRGLRARRRARGPGRRPEGLDVGDGHTKICTPNSYQTWQ
jgi:hypothetical protein